MALSMMPVEYMDTFTTFHQNWHHPPLYDNTRNTARRITAGDAPVIVVAGRTAGVLLGGRSGVLERLLVVACTHRDQHCQAALPAAMPRAAQTHRGTKHTGAVTSG